jgi:hypothetical protein
MTKILAIALGALTMFNPRASLANEPSSSSNSTAQQPRTPTTQTTTTSTQSVHQIKRQKWVVKRMRHLERHHTIDTIVLSGSPKSASEEFKHQYMMNRFEYLALKSQRGGLSRKEYAEFRLLFEALGPRSR